MITSGTVQVPARNPVNNKKVVALKGARNSSGVEVGYTYQNLEVRHRLLLRDQPGAHWQQGFSGFGLVWGDQFLPVAQAFEKN